MVQIFCLSGELCSLAMYISFYTLSTFLMLGVNKSLESPPKFILCYNIEYDCKRDLLNDQNSDTFWRE
jgi:hypothetical protein